MKVILFFVALTQAALAIPFTELNVSTINMWGVPLQRKMAFARSEALGKEIQQQSIDLVFIQEAFHPAMRGNIRHFSGDDYRGLYILPKTLRLNHGLYNVTKTKVTKASFIPFKYCGGIQCLSKKGILYMQLELDNGRKVDTFNTHLQAYEDDMLIRQYQLRTLRNFINMKNNGDLPVIMAGDFNIISGFKEHESFKLKFSDFKDSYKVSRPNEDGHTWAPFENYWTKPDYEESTLNQRLDYIFVRDGINDFWEVIDSNIAFNKELSWGQADSNLEIFISDHFGVTSNLRLIHEGMRPL